MTYFKINGVDYSQYVNQLKVAKEHIYKSLTNASGNTLVKLVNSKHVIEVGIIPLDASVMKTLQAAVDGFKVNISFWDPQTNTLKENMACIIPTRNVEYYTIQAAGNVKFKACSLVFNEL